MGGHRESSSRQVRGGEGERGLFEDSPIEGRVSQPGTMGHNGQLSQVLDNSACGKDGPNSHQTTASSGPNQRPKGWHLGWNLKVER